MVPIHPQDQPLLGVMWKDLLYTWIKLSYLACIQFQRFSLQVQMQFNGF